MFLLYSLSLGAPIWPIGVGGPQVRPVRAHSSYATERCAFIYMCIVYEATKCGSDISLYIVQNSCSQYAHGRYMSKAHVFV